MGCNRVLVPTGRLFTMKLLAATFTALVAFASVQSHVFPDFGEGPLYEDIQYFIDMIPLEDVTKVVLYYAAEDAEFGELLNYFRAQPFKTMMKEIEEIPEFKEFAGYLQQNGVYVYEQLNKLNRVLGIPPFQQTFATRQTFKTRGLRGLFEDVKSLVSYDSFIHGYVYKMRTSETFRDFVAQLKSPGNQAFVNKLYDNERYVRFRNMLVSKGLDIALVEDIIYTVLGIEFPVLEALPAFYAQSQLSKDIHDFLDLIDLNQVTQIVLSYLDDDEVQKAMEYMYSDEFHELVHVVEALPVYQDLVNYLQDAGLDMYNFLQKVHKLFGMEDYVPPERNDKRRSMQVFVNRGGVKGLVDDVIAVLPMDKFKAMYREKLRDSEAFRLFIDKIQSEEFHTLVNAIYTSPIFLEMRQKTIDAGLNLEPAKKIVESIIGFPLPTPS